MAKPLLHNGQLEARSFPRSPSKLGTESPGYNQFFPIPGLNTFPTASPCLASREARCRGWLGPVGRPCSTLSGILSSPAQVLAGGEKQRNWSSSSWPHTQPSAGPALRQVLARSWRQPALWRGGCGGAGGSSDLVWLSGLALAASISSQHNPSLLGYPKQATWGSVGTAEVRGVGSQEVPQKAPLSRSADGGWGLFVSLRVHIFRVKAEEAPSWPTCPVPRPLPL